VPAEKRVVDGEINCQRVHVRARLGCVSVRVLVGLLASELRVPAAVRVHLLRKFAHT
jgi:hypothetical protein